MDTGKPYNLGAALSALKPKDKTPRSATILNNWISQAEKHLQSGGGRVRVEISPEEGSAGDATEMITSPSLAGFGLPTPDHLVGLSMRYQIAQKLHPGSDPHNPPEYINERARDLVDLLLLKELVESADSPTLTELRQVGVDIFDARANEAATLGSTPRPWPPFFTPYPHWVLDYTKAAESAGVTTPLDEAVTIINTWIKQIDEAR